MADLSASQRADWRDISEHPRAQVGTVRFVFSTWMDYSVQDDSRLTTTSVGRSVKTRLSRKTNRTKFITCIEEEAEIAKPGQTPPTLTKTVSFLGKYVLLEAELHFGSVSGYFGGELLPYFAQTLRNPVKFQPKLTENIKRTIKTEAKMFFFLCSPLSMRLLH